MFIVGLTGGIGTGKSTVAKFLRELGAPVVDADVIARKVVEPGKPAWKQIKKEFGDSILLADGTINRPLLGEIIFSDPEKRRILNKITHPYIHRSMAWEVLKYFFKAYQFVVMDLPLLFETGVFVDYINKTIVVYCDEDQQVDRVMTRNRFTNKEAKKRISAQMSLDQKCEKASFVVDNTGSLEETRTQTERIYNILRGSRAQWRVRLLFMGWAAAVLGFIAYICSQIPAKKH